MAKIANELDYELVMVTNQDGLGTDSFPENTFWPTHNKLIQAFENEGILFAEVLIDKTFPHENAATRKPRTGLLTKYLVDGAFDLENSYVIGDRLTDIELAKNIGAKGILINNEAGLASEELSVGKEQLQEVIALETKDWKNIYEFLKLSEQNS